MLQAYYDYHAWAMGRLLRLCDGLTDEQLDAPREIALLLRAQLVGHRRVARVRDHRRAVVDCRDRHGMRAGGGGDAGRAAGDAGGGAIDQAAAGGDVDAAGHPAAVGVKIASWQFSVLLNEINESVTLRTGCVKTFETFRERLEDKFRAS